MLGRGSITDLGSLGGHATVATAINQSNQIVGYSADSNGNVLAFVYTDKITSLGTLRDGSNSEAFAINLSGQAVGDSQAGGDTHRPFLFAGDQVKDLGASTKACLSSTRPVLRVRLTTRGKSLPIVRVKLRSARLSILTVS